VRIVIPWLYGTGSGKRYFVFGLGSGVVKRPVSLVAGHQKSWKFCISLSYLILTRAGLKGLNISLYLTFRNLFMSTVSYVTIILKITKLKQTY